MPATGAFRYHTREDQVLRRAIQRKIADAIELGRKIHPDWTRCIGAFYRTKTGIAQDHPTEFTTQACALGFARVGGYDGSEHAYLATLDVGDEEYTDELSIANINDRYGWTLDEIISELRKQGKEPEDADSQSEQ